MTKFSVRYGEPYPKWLDKKLSEMTDMEATHFLNDYPELPDTPKVEGMLKKTWNELNC